MFEKTFPLSVLNFFTIGEEIFFHNPKIPTLNKKYLLPSTNMFFDEEEFAKIYLCWSFDGLFIYAYVEKSFEEVSYPDFQKGDSLELFIDTRDLKTKSFLTKFCHHFVFFPEKILNYHVKEITRFRGDDMHKLCDSSLINVEPEFNKSYYALDIFLPSAVLFGYDPQKFDRLGFTYRINRKAKPAQHFAVSSLEYSIEQNPSLWASLKMEK